MMTDKELADTLMKNPWTIASLRGIPAEKRAETWRDIGISEEQIAEWQTMIDGGRLKGRPKKPHTLAYGKPNPDAVDPCNITIRPFEKG